MSNSSKNIDKTYIFESMPVRQAVLKQIVPAILSQMIVLLYNLADMFFVGRLNDPIQTAAVAVCNAPFLMLTAVSNLFAIGGAGMVAQSLGKHDRVSAGKIASISFWFGLMSAVACSLTVLFLAEPILSICGATDSTMVYAYGYIKWSVIYGGIGTVLNILLANLVRAEGYSEQAAFGVSFGGILNIILDPIFIEPFGLSMGAEGAGLATAISNTVSMLILLGFILSHRKTTCEQSAEQSAEQLSETFHAMSRRNASYRPCITINIRPSALKSTGTYIGKILSIGFPSAVQYALTVVAVAALTKFVSAYTDEALAALGIVKKLDMIPLYFSIGLSNGLLPLLAYNYARGDQKRRSQAFKFGCGISLGFALFTLVIYEIFAPFLTSLFIKDAVTIEYASVFLRIMVVAMPLMSLAYPFIIQFQAMGRVKESLICSIIRKGVLDIPLLFILDALIPLYGCTAVQPIVDGISLVVALIFYRKIQSRC